MRNNKQATIFDILSENDFGTVFLHLREVYVQHHLDKRPSKQGFGIDATIPIMMKNNLVFTVPEEDGQSEVLTMGMI